MLMSALLLCLLPLFCMAQLADITTKCSSEIMVCTDRQHCDTGGQVTLFRSNKLTFTTDNRGLQVNVWWGKELQYAEEIHLSCNH